MDISIFSANCSKVKSVKCLKKGKQRKICLFDYLRKEVFMEEGRLEINAESSSRLKFFFMFAHYSM